jgi:hypothetical protein
MDSRIPTKSRPSFGRTSVISRHVIRVVISPAVDRAHGPEPRVHYLNTPCILSNKESGMKLGTVHDERYKKYIEWANDSVLQLARLLSSEDIERLILTKRYWTLQAMSHDDVTRVTGLFLDREIQERIQYLEELLREFRLWLDRLQRDAVSVVPDTSMFIEHVNSKSGI